MGQLQNKTTLQKSKNSFLNEIRGRLLEFSCAKAFASFYNVEFEFLESLDLNFISELQQYQDYLKQNDQRSYRYIENAGKELIKKIELDKTSNIKKILMTGQWQINEQFKEADIVVQGETEELYSIKLIKKNSYINSKSAGIKSLFEKYFGEVEVQRRLNQNVELYFENFRIDFYSHFDCPLDEVNFLDLIKKYKISDRPGELPSELSQILFDFYKKCIDDLHHHFSSLLKKDKEVFLQNIYPLVGFGNKDLKVLTFFHCQNFQTLDLSVHDWSILKTSNVKILPVSGNTSFLIELDHLSLQVRVKPMNSYLAPSMKVNCSVKFKDEK